MENIQSTFPILACSRLSDSGEDAKVKGTRKVGGRKRGKGREFAPVLFSSSRLLNSAGPTISEAETGYLDIHNNIRCLHFF